MENVKEFHERNQEVTVKETEQKHLLYAEVSPPHSFREISIATK